jgi:hypothetical protein
MPKNIESDRNRFVAQQHGIGPVRDNAQNANKGCFLIETSLIDKEKLEP